MLHYQDTSTGHIVAQHRTRLGPCRMMRQNPWNSVLGLGHTGGVVTLWTPNITTPVVKMLCHRGAVNALAFDASGRYMVTAGAWRARVHKSCVWLGKREMGQGPRVGGAVLGPERGQ